MITRLQELAENEKNKIGRRRHLMLIESLARQIKDAELFEKTRIAFWGKLSTIEKLSSLLYQKFRSLHSIDSLDAIFGCGCSHRQ